ncbi:Vitamin B12 import ATP-binding protein BtuD [Castellaniella defragrans]
MARAGIGIVFQHSRPLRRQTVLENIKLALLPDSIWPQSGGQRTEQKALEIAERVGLGGVVDRRPPTLPFADLRRIEMARAIARDPRVVLIDEPFAGLAADEVKAFADLIRSFRDDGRAVLLVDHNVKSVAALADRVYAMHLGEPVAEGTPQEVLQHETVRQVYLGGSIGTVRERTEAVDSRPTLLDVHGVSVLYGKALALDEVSIRVNEGQFVSVVGLNGAGKTSLFNAISGVVPYRGTIRFGDEVLGGKPPGAIARSGLVQCPETRELFTAMSVRENLDLGGAHLAVADCAQQIDWIFELFPILKSRQRQLAGTLSGGEQQMLAIARALMTRPRLLILDEPTLGLAPVILEQLSRAIERLQQGTGITMLLGEQNVTFALPHADHVYVLEQSRIAWEGEPHRFAQEMGADYL